MTDIEFAELRYSGKPARSCVAFALCTSACRSTASFSVGSILAMVKILEITLGVY
jgi:hypothetical protein